MDENDLIATHFEIIMDSCHASVTVQKPEAIDTILHVIAKMRVDFFCIFAGFKFWIVVFCFELYF